MQRIERHLHGLIYGLSMLGTLKNPNTTAVNGTAPFMAQLKNENLIPSISYGYTTGAIYRKSHFFRVKDQKSDALFQANS